MLENLLAPKFLALYIVVAAAVYVHYRGRVRHGFLRPLTDHSSLMAPYNALMYLLSAVPNRPFIDVAQFPERASLRDNRQTIREEVIQLLDQGHIRAAAKYNDLGFNSFFRTGWKRFYGKWYDRTLPSASAPCPRTVALVEAIPIRKRAVSSSTASHITGAMAKQSCSTKRSSIMRRTRPT